MLGLHDPEVTLMPDPSPALEARRARVSRIRRRVIGGASGLFFITTGAIVVQLVSGHDPALAHAAAARAASAGSTGWHRHDHGGFGDPDAGGSTNPNARGFTDPDGSGTGQPPSSTGQPPSGTGQPPGTDGQSPGSPSQQVAPLTTRQS
jgi:hypothetical protein